MKIIYQGRRLRNEFKLLEAGFGRKWTNSSAEQMNEKNYNWHKIATCIGEINFSENAMAEVEVAGKTICIVLLDDKLFACTKKCPHAGGLMADGFVDSVGNIVCPVHRYRFSLQNGRNTSGEGYYLKIFPVEIRKEGVFVGFAQSGLFKW